MSFGCIGNKYDFFIIVMRIWWCRQCHGAKHILYYLYSEYHLLFLWGPWGEMWSRLVGVRLIYEWYHDGFALSTQAVSLEFQTSWWSTEDRQNDGGVCIPVLPMQPWSLSVYRSDSLDFVHIAFIQTFKNKYWVIANLMLIQVMKNYVCTTKGHACFLNVRWWGRLIVCFKLKQTHAPNLRIMWRLSGLIWLAFH